MAFYLTPQYPKTWPFGLTLRQPLKHLLETLLVKVKASPRKGCTMSPGKVDHPGIQGMKKKEVAGRLCGPNSRRLVLWLCRRHMKFLHRPYIPLESNL